MIISQGTNEAMTVGRSGQITFTKSVPLRGWRRFVAWLLQSNTSADVVRT